MSEKLELKDIACYLPYGLKCASNSSCVSTVIGLTKGTANDIARIKPNEGRDYPVPVGSIKPILRPMSDLINPLPDGTIPIVELASIALDNVDLPDYRILTGNYSYSIGFVEQPGLGATSFHIGIDWDMAIYEGGELGTAYSQVDLFNYLYQHHFDINNLIWRGLAIDINTIKI